MFASAKCNFPWCENDRSIGVFCSFHYLQQNVLLLPHLVNEHSSHCRPLTSKASFPTGLPFNVPLQNQLAENLFILQPPMSQPASSNVQLSSSVSVLPNQRPMSALSQHAGLAGLTSVATCSPVTFSFPQSSTNRSCFPPAENYIMPSVPPLVSERSSVSQYGPCPSPVATQVVTSVTAPTRVVTSCRRFGFGSDPVPDFSSFHVLPSNTKTPTGSTMQQNLPGTAPEGHGSYSNVAATFSAAPKQSWLYCPMMELKRAVGVGHKESESLLSTNENGMCSPFSEGTTRCQLQEGCFSTVSSQLQMYAPPLNVQSQIEMQPGTGEIHLILNNDIQQETPHAAQSVHHNSRPVSESLSHLGYQSQGHSSSPSVTTCGSNVSVDEEDCIIIDLEDEDENYASVKSGPINERIITPPHSLPSGPSSDQRKNHMSILPKPKNVLNRTKPVNYIESREVFVDSLPPTVDSLPPTVEMETSSFSSSPLSATVLPVPDQDMVSEEVSQIQILETVSLWNSECSCIESTGITGAGAKYGDTFEEVGGKSFQQLSSEGFYRCGCDHGRCGFFTPFPSQLEVHLKEAHPNASVSPCVHCGMGLQSHDDLVSHLDQHMTNESAFKCLVINCDFQSFSLEEVLTHLIQRHPCISNFTCWQCNSKFHGFNNFFIHIKQNLLSVMQCPYCSAKHVNRNGILSHISTSHPGLGLLINYSAILLCLARKNYGWWQQQHVSGENLQCDPTQIIVAQDSKPFAMHINDVSPLDTNTSKNVGDVWDDTSQQNEQEEFINIAVKYHYVTCKTEPPDIIDVSDCENNRDDGNENDGGADFHVHQEDKLRESLATNTRGSEVDVNAGAISGGENVENSSGDGSFSSPSSWMQATYHRSTHSRDTVQFQCIFCEHGCSDEMDHLDHLYAIHRNKFFGFFCTHCSFITANQEVQNSHSCSTSTYSRSHQNNGQPVTEQNSACGEHAVVQKPGKFLRGRKRKIFASSSATVTAKKGQVSNHTGIKQSPVNTRAEAMAKGSHIDTRATADNKVALQMSEASVKSSSVSTNSKTRQKKHCKVQRLQCKECSYSNAYSQSMNQHVFKEHLMQKCPVCQAHVKCFADLYKHFQLKHGKQADVLKEKYKWKHWLKSQHWIHLNFQCLQCTFSVTRDERNGFPCDMRKHIMKVHLKYKCPVCKQSVRQFLELRQHFKIKHPENLQVLLDKYKVKNMTKSYRINRHKSQTTLPAVVNGEMDDLHQSACRIDIALENSPKRLRVDLDRIRSPPVATSWDTDLPDSNSCSPLCESRTSLVSLSKFADCAESETTPRYGQIVHCQECSFASCSLNKLTNHIFVRHLNRSCPQCQVSVENYQILYRHFKTEHPNSVCSLMEQLNPGKWYVRATANSPLSGDHSEYEGEPTLTSNSEHHQNQSCSPCSSESSIPSVSLSKNAQCDESTASPNKENLSHSKLNCINCTFTCVSLNKMTKHIFVKHFNSCCPQCNTFMSGYQSLFRHFKTKHSKNACTLRVVYSPEQWYRSSTATFDISDNYAKCEGETVGTRSPLNAENIVLHNKENDESEDSDHQDADDTLQQCENPGKSDQPSLKQKKGIPSQAVIASQKLSGTPVNFLQSKSSTLHAGELVSSFCSHTTTENETSALVIKMEEGEPSSKQDTAGSIHQNDVSEQEQIDFIATSGHGSEFLLVLNRETASDQVCEAEHAPTLIFTPGQEQHALANSTMEEEQKDLTNLKSILGIPRKSRSTKFDLAAQLWADSNLFEDNLVNEDMEYRCPHCIGDFLQPFRFYEHLCYHYHYRCFKCELCQFLAFSKTSVYNHSQREHPDVTPSINHLRTKESMESRIKRVMKKNFVQITDPYTERRLKAYDRARQKKLDKQILSSVAKGLNVKKACRKSDVKWGPKKVISSMAKMKEKTPKIAVKEVRTKIDVLKNPKRCVSKVNELEWLICPYCRKEKKTQLKIENEICYHIHYKPFCCIHCEFTSSSWNYVQSHSEKEHHTQLFSVKYNRVEVKEQRFKCLFDRAVLLSSPTGTIPGSNEVPIPYLSTLPTACFSPNQQTDPSVESLDELHPKVRTKTIGKKMKTKKIKKDRLLTGGSVIVSCCHCNRFSFTQGKKTQEECNKKLTEHVQRVHPKFCSYSSGNREDVSNHMLEKH